MQYNFKKVPELYNVDRDILQQEIIPSYQPAILKGVFNHWPAVKAGRESSKSIMDYLFQFDEGRNVHAIVSPSSIKGSFNYQDDMKGFNFRKISEPFRDCVTRIASHIDDSDPPTIYMGSTKIEECIPDFKTHNVCNLLDERISPRLWIGNATHVPAHFDLSDNIACVVAGKRRFTLFPPEQISNLYIGPIDFTPAGQPISIVPLDAPNLEKFPRFGAALAEAMVADLEPGDAIYIPNLWWHNVQALEKFNILLNYWWRNEKIGVDTPYETLVHALMTMRALPLKEKKAWRAFFDYYIFNETDDSVAHIPPNVRGVLGDLTPNVYMAIRNYFLHLLKK